MTLLNSSLSFPFFSLPSLSLQQPQAITYSSVFCFIVETFVTPCFNSSIWSSCLSFAILYQLRSSLGLDVRHNKCRDCSIRLNLSSKNTTQRKVPLDSPFIFTCILYKLWESQNIAFFTFAEEIIWKSFSKIISSAKSKNVFIICIHNG